VSTESLQQEEYAPTDGPRALDALRVIELGGIGPVPFGGMLLSDMGADVVRIDRPRSTYIDQLWRGKKSIIVDLRTPEGVDVVRRLLATADVLLEGFRPGVLERLGFTPETCWESNPRLVIGRMSGWGQEGPRSQEAGHDVNFIGLSGVLNSIGPRDQKPSIPLNLVGDYGGGGLLMAFGVLCAVFEARANGRGQVVDAAMVDGAALLMTKWFGELAAGHWNDGRGRNATDGASHYYNVYRTADDKYVAVGAIEDKFYERVTSVLGVDDQTDDRRDPACWPHFTDRFASVFRTRTRDEWMAAFDGEDSCVSPVLSMGEAVQDPHLTGPGAKTPEDPGSGRIPTIARWRHDIGPSRAGLQRG
jgi:alpha-methylacyl-CoA racemase